MTPDQQKLYEEMEQVYEDCMKKWNAHGKVTSHKKIWIEALMKIAEEKQSQKIS